MMHSNISHFKNLTALVVFVAFVAVEFLYAKSGNEDIFFLLKNDDSKKELLTDMELNDENDINQDIVISTTSIFDTGDFDEIIDGKNDGIKYATVSESYFKNTLFIGDSRTEGFRMYKDIPGVTYYCNPSFGVYSGFNRTMQLPYFGLITLGDLLNIQKFDKIYICLGINNIATDIQSHKKMYEQFIEKVKELQPNAIIFLIANLKVTREQSNDRFVNVESISLINDFIKDFADYEKIFFLDPNPLYVDEEGYLPSYLSNDGCHLKIMYYDRYLEFLLEHGIIEE